MSPGKQETAAPRGEALVCDDTHSTEETSKHFLTRDRQRADEHTSNAPSRGAQATDINVAAASSASSPDRNAHSGPRPASGVSPAVIQVFRY
ncbi:hypothetical protein [Streptomyces sporangiiformans]|uniref:Uncharacterized protein n=1 Tax=Streptomyces sporangiiformans TaxID=2315329 RepID=A0A505DJX8_9ACTN|nr:hypothetical protein [Streptomyces sporangiiformans]TPQ19926.1 hypothetical protein FGD71_023060 [Streptomyces sporangiiformans]